jgi:hypothetical protein
VRFAEPNFPTFAPAVVRSRPSLNTVES